MMFVDLMLSCKKIKVSNRSIGCQVLWLCSTVTATVDHRLSHKSHGGLIVVMFTFQLLQVWANNGVLNDSWPASE